MSQHSSQSHLDSFRNQEVDDGWSQALRNGHKDQKRLASSWLVSRCFPGEWLVSLTPSAWTTYVFRGQKKDHLQEGLRGTKWLPSLPCPSHTGLASRASFPNPLKAAQASPGFSDPLLFWHLLLLLPPPCGSSLWFSLWWGWRGGASLTAWL